MYELVRKLGRVKKIIGGEEGFSLVEVEMAQGKIAKAINYDWQTGVVAPGDQVVLNTTAVDLNLGTGGYHFIQLNLSKLNLNSLQEKPGHIMKLRYTPWQMRTLSVEEEASPYHNPIKGFKDLQGQAVVIIPLHSLLAPLLITFKYFFPEGKTVYIMTEGGSLVLELSNQVRLLKQKNLLNKTITVGQALGGDLEAVNIFTGLAAAQVVCQADLIVVGMGPGIVGTNTKYGFSEVENAFVQLAVQKLKGRSIYVPRISFSDPRKRHRGISHHSLTILGELFAGKVELAVPDLQEIITQIQENKIDLQHQVFYYKIDEVKKILEDSNFAFRSMGRSFSEDPLFFITAGLAVYRIIAV